MTTWEAAATVRGHILELNKSLTGGAWATRVLTPMSIRTSVRKNLGQGWWPTYLAARGRHGEPAAAVKTDRVLFSTSPTTSKPRLELPLFDKSKSLTFVQPPDPKWDFGHGTGEVHANSHYAPRVNEEEAECIIRRRWNLEDTSPKYVR